VHLRRLLPIEEVLSQFPVGGAKQGPGVATARAVNAPASTPTRTPVNTGATARILETSAAPAFSPFEKDQGRRRFDEKAVVTQSAVPIAVPMPVPVELPAPKAVPLPAELTLTEEDVRGEELAKTGDFAGPGVRDLAVPEESVAEAQADVQRASLHSAEDLQRAAVDALSGAKNQDTAADALADAEWVVTEDEIRVQTELSKTMLPMVVNAEAERLVKAALRDAGAEALKLALLPGVKATAVKKPRAVKSGSAQAKAMEHPIVQRAQTLFNAEIRSVIDLREND